VRSLSSRLATLKLRGRKGSRAEYHLRAARQPSFYKTAALVARYTLEKIHNYMIFIYKYHENERIVATGQGFGRYGRGALAVRLLAPACRAINMASSSACSAFKRGSTCDR
jgi:hypothetical protein